MSRISSKAQRRFADQAQRPKPVRHDAVRNDRQVAAHLYAERGWAVFPVGASKVPRTEHGRSDATVDPKQIDEWWHRWPDALVAISTGPESGIVALDIDVTPTSSGWDSLECLGVSAAPETTMSHTPRGGTHCLFMHPGHFVKTIAGKLGRNLDIRGDGGSITLPPGPGRCWDSVYSRDFPPAVMPGWMVIPEPKMQPAGSDPRGSSRIRLTRYGEAALDNAVNRIVTAPAGQQEMILNTEVFGIGRLAGAGVIPPDLGLAALLWAARRLPSHDGRRPWRAADLDRKVRLAFTDGLSKPRAVPS